MIDFNELPLSEVAAPVYRVISTRYPQVHLFERVASPEEWEVLYAVEALTNDRLRDQVGEIRLVPPEDRVYGDGASWIMAAFTHAPVDGRGGRFNRDFGVFYCSNDENVSVAESSYNRARFLRESRLFEPIQQEMRVLRADLGPVELHDVRHLVGHPIYDQDDYGEAQALGSALRKAKSYGIHYSSVRTDGECFGVMRPTALSEARHLRYLRYCFEDGECVAVESIGGDG